MNRSHRTSIKRTAVVGRGATGRIKSRGKQAGHRVHSLGAKPASKGVPSGFPWQDTQAPESGLPLSWIFLDPSLSDAEALLTSLQGEVVHLDPSRHGLEQVAGWLHGQNDVQAIHLLTSGEAGVMTLGSSVLDAHSLSDQHAEALAVIAGALSPKAQFHVHGADLNADAAGEALMHALASITGAHVQASGHGRAAAGDGSVRNVSVSTSQGNAVHGTSVGSDRAQAHLTFCIGAIPLNGMLLVHADGAWMYTPDEGFHGQDGFSIVVLEGRRIKDTVNVQVQVQMEVLGEAPALACIDIDVDVDVGAAVEPDIMRLVTAVDGQKVKPDDIVSVNRGQVVAGVGGALAFLPAPGFIGATTFACTVSDGLGGCTEVQVQVETLDDLAESWTRPPAGARSDAREEAMLRAALLRAFEQASPGHSVGFMAPITAADGMRLTPLAVPPGAPDVTH